MFINYSITGAILAALSATAFVATPAIAQDKDCPGWARGAGKGMGWQRGAGQGFMRRFGVIDENDDGRISADEAATQRESVFLAMDADDDGELTEKEYMTVRMGMGQGRNKARMEARQKAKRARFKPMDLDKSGTVSKAEWMSAGKARFEAADTNKDGVVTPWEFRAMRRS